MSLRVILIRTEVSEEGEKNRRARNDIKNNWQPKHSAKKYSYSVPVASSC
jgi:hypothetical protein